MTENTNHCISFFLGWEKANRIRTKFKFIDGL